MPYNTTQHAMNFDASELLWFFDRYQGFLRDQTFVDSAPAEIKHIHNERGEESGKISGTD